MADSWRHILWREWYFCYDDDYADRLQRLIGDWPASSYVEIKLKTQGRPSTMAVEAALRQACKVRRSKYDWDERLQDLDQTRHQNLPLEELVDQLNTHHWLERVIACHLLVPYGGEAVASLKINRYGDTPHLHSLAQWILQSIEVETTERLSRDANQLLCTTCFVHCYPLKITIPGYESITYYGCRACGQSRSFKTWREGVVATLDADMSEDHLVTGGRVHVNWLQRRKLFDFDWVEIIRASDEDAERFAVQAGNDTDEVRRPRYKEMRCVIDPACELSNNTLKILESMFGEVQHAPVA